MLARISSILFMYIKTVRLKHPYQFDIGGQANNVFEHSKNIHCTMHVYVANNLCDSVWLFRTGIKPVQVFYYFFISILSMEIHFISILSLEIHLSEREDWNHKTSLTPPYFCASSKPGPGFSPMPNDIVSFMFNYLK